MGGFASANDDILQNIVSRLPALSFASAACVSKTWNKVCDRVLSRPKLAAALSVNGSLQDGVKEVVDKVLSSPIRPQFFIASVGLAFNLEEAHRLISEKLHSRIPVITNATYGIMGRDAVSNAMREVRWNIGPEEDANSQENTDFNRGIVLIAGFFPGLKVDTIPLLRPKRVMLLPVSNLLLDSHFDYAILQECPISSKHAKVKVSSILKESNSTKMGHEHGVAMIDNFLMDIKNYTASVSGSVAPAGIIVFGDKRIDMRPFLADIDSAIPEETVIVGDANSRFLCRNGNHSRNYSADEYNFDAVALVFARDKDKPHDMGETRFHVALATGVMPFGPELRAISVTSSGLDYSWLIASINGFDDILDCQRLLADIGEEMDDESADVYIGVIQKRPSLIEPEKMESRTYMAYYEVLGGEEEYLVVEGVGIKPGDKFLFYHSDSATASSSVHNAYESIQALKAASSSKRRYSMRDVAGPSASAAAGGRLGEVFGGLIFGCHYQGESYYDCFPIFNSFPGVPIAGVICNQQIGRDPTGVSMWPAQESGESPAICTQHACSTVYLVISYVPPSPN
ncbi:hypothetical protein COLO4_07119 [Corchorus olitorius]|uniref:F-box domain-containing protein n=1 Tax=Corchorus olitorius TaxID=93759 RepID=A0A1R3KKV2_9ROSI|nr:hypothetical protein COLO4_07119 [Corchorus olitorius]